MVNMKSIILGIFAVIIISAGASIVTTLTVMRHSSNNSALKSYQNAVSQQVSTQEGAIAKVGEQAAVPVMKGFWGEVEKVGENKIILKINPAIPLPNAKLYTRTVLIDKNTVVAKYVPKKSADANIPTSPKNTEQIPADNNFTELPAVFSDIAVGQKVIVRSNMNVKETPEFTATRVEIYPDKN